jgi:hypothetical protein
MYQVFIAVRVFLYIKGESIGAEVEGPKLDAYLEEELYDTLVYCIQNLKADDFETKRKRAEEIG